MSHSEARTSAPREAALALFTGSFYGGVHTVVGHPLDTIKSRLQMDPTMRNASALDVAKSLWKTDGLRGFFRGCVPPLWGSMVYRGIMYSGYEFSFTFIEKGFPDDHFLKNELSPSFPVRPMVVASTVFAASCRGIIESPIEYAKVMGQMKQPWVLTHVYRGVQWQLLRTTALLIPIFSILDVARRKTDLTRTLPGNFLVMSGACGVSYLCCWPLETLKNLAQTGIG
ncbi:hypothetical protein DYB37_005196 [Aphanomyces astaci]|uniref:Mitochondrial carrier protein n=1 Tax=Aphanomyces astaci TaxID=112090 RepID=A0A3L6V8G6_APHAT|nr:hypothetical protein DYB35_011249 [Aphanomyces astaci]RHZ32428.1 hypothetical protein DYB37_005196 [Aphanomyces astaci]RLO05044.1 hypothetical protein DYB28_007904 [Aphanomyces astaci]